MRGRRRGARPPSGRSGPPPAPPSEIKKGVVRDEGLRSKAVNKIKRCALELGFTIISEADSGLKGPKGNLEHFIFLKK